MTTQLTPQRKQELQQICEAMSSVSNTFYKGAIHTGNHAFIEFCGLMNGYINACRNTIDKDIDFTEANIHGGVALPLQDHELDYVAEKFSCIYGESFSIKNAIPLHPIGMAQQEALKFIQRLATEDGAIVSSGNCSQLEIANAQKSGRFLVDHDGLGYVLRLKRWRQLAETCVHESVAND